MGLMGHPRDSIQPSLLFLKEDTPAPLEWGLPAAERGQAPLPPQALFRDCCPTVCHTLGGGPWSSLDMVNMGSFWGGV